MKIAKREKIIKVIEKIIAHRLFKPISISIITSFILFNSVAYVHSYLTDRKEKQIRKTLATPIKIRLTEDGKTIDFDEIQIVEHRIKSGETILQFLNQIGAKESDIFSILSEIHKIYNAKDIKAGDTLIVRYKSKIIYSDKDLSKETKKDILISEFRFVPSVEREIIVTRENDGKYKAKDFKRHLTGKIVRYSGEIKNGLYVDAVRAGVSPTTMMNMINLYAYDIDFQRDLREGNKFEIIVEGYFSDTGKKIKDGNVLFSSLKLSDRAVEIYAFKTNGNLEYFDATGGSVRRSLLRTPVNGARISSGFGFRKHPILGYSKLHKGVDFAAPTGTPIYAAGNGTIMFMGRHGGYGNFVKIKHNSEYETQYGHISKFSNKFRVGSKVKQGDVVAYVGSTGRSTGPHLHFEVVYRGQAINPSKVKSVSGLKLLGKELERFKAEKIKIDGYRKIPNQIKQ